MELSEENREQVETNEIPVDDQLAYLEMVEENADGGWMASVMHVGTLMIFGLSADDYEKFDTNEKKALGELGFEIMGDAWQIYAQTKNVFGHKIDEGWLGDEDDQQSEPAQI